MKNLLLYLLLFTSFGFYAQTNNYSLEFDGVDDYVIIPNGSQFVDDVITASFWAKLNNDIYQDPEVIALGSASNTRWGCGVSTQELVPICGRGCSGSGSAPQNGNLVEGNWYYITMVFDNLNDTAQVFLNSNYLYTRSNNSSSLTCTSTALYLAVDIFGAPEYVALNMDDVSIWNTALSQSQIQQYMDCPPTGSEAGLVGYWNFEEGSGTTIADQTTNSNDGTLNGGVTWSTDVPPYNCCTANPITSQPTNQTVNMGNDATFTFTDSLTAATYQWQLDAGTGYTNLSNAGQFSGTDTKTLTVSAVTMSNNNTNYRCLVTESSSCSDTTDIANLTVSSGNSINEYVNAAVKIYPNPTNGWVALSLSNTTNGQVILTDLLGKEVLSKSFTSNEVQLNLKSLEAKGTYFAKVLDADSNVIAIKKLIYQ